MPATVKLEGTDVPAARSIGYGRSTDWMSNLVARGPMSNATCQSEFEWTYNAQDQTPCVVAAAVVGGCQDANYTVPALVNASNSYDPPGKNGHPVTPCTCSWAAYNLFSACTVCQGVSSSVLTWANYKANCGSDLSSTTYYPADVVTLSNTSIPFYATTQPTNWTNSIFNTTQAHNIVNQSHPDVYGAPLTTSSTNSSGKSKSNGGAIGGGVAGGVVVLIIGAIAVWWILRKRGISPMRRRRNGKPQEIDSTAYNSTTGHARTWSDLTKTSHIGGDTSFGNSSPSMGPSAGYIGTIGMQQVFPAGLSPSPFSTSSVNMGSVSSSGMYTTPPHQSVIHVDGNGGGAPSMYNDRASTISRYDSPSPSMQFMNRSQSPESNSHGNPFVVGGTAGGTVVTGGADTMTVQPFVLPPLSTSPPLPPTKGRTQIGTVQEEGDNMITRMNSQESLNGTSPLPTPPPARRMMPPTYAEVTLSDSREVAANRRETHGTGHRPSLPEKQPSQTSQISQQSSQETSLWSDAPTSVGHGVGIAIGHGPGQGPTPELAAIDAYVNQVIRPGASGGAGASAGAEAADTVPVLHTTAVPPGQTFLRRPSEAPGRRLTMNTTEDDGDHSVVGGHTREDDDGEIA